MASLHHSFDINLAQQYGIEEAILIHHFQHWVSINKRLNKNLKDGKTWSYQTQKEMQANFPYMTLETIKYTLEKLIEKGVLIRKNYNKIPIDKTWWYAFSDESKFIPNSKNVYDTENSVSTRKIPPPIPDTRTQILNTNTTPPTPSRGLFVSKEKKEQQRQEGKTILAKLAETICQYSRDPVVLDGIKILDHAYFDRSRNVSICFNLPKQEIFQQIKATYGQERPYLLKFYKENALSLK